MSLSLLRDHQTTPPTITPTASSTKIITTASKAFSQPGMGLPPFSVAQLFNLRIASYQLALLPLLQMLIEPADNCPVPESRVRRLPHPVTFVRKINQLRIYSHPLNCGEHLQAFTFGHAIVETVCDDQDGRLKVLHEFVRRPAIVHGRVGPGRALEFPVGEPKLLRRTVHAGEIVNAIVRHEHFEPEPRIVVVTFNPVDHVTTIAGAGPTYAGLVDVRQRGSLGHAILDVEENLATPVAGNFADQPLPIAG